MSDTKNSKVILDRWTVFKMAAGVSLLIGLFWGMWSIFLGPIPIIEKIALTSDTTFEIPFAMSRWWTDMLIPFWWGMSASYFYVKEERRIFLKSMFTRSRFLTFFLIVDLLCAAYLGVMRDSSDGILALTVLSVAPMIFFLFTLNHHKKEFIIISTDNVYVMLELIVLVYTLSLAIRHGFIVGWMADASLLLLLTLKPITFDLINKT